MKRTHQTETFFKLAAVIGLSACLLIGCTRADSGTSSQNSSAGSSSGGQGAVTGTVSAQAENSLAGAGSTTDDASAQSTDTTAQQGTVQGTTDTADSSQQTPQSVSGTTTDSANGTAAAGQNTTAQTPTPETDDPEAAVTYDAINQSDGGAEGVGDSGSPVSVGAPADEAFTGQFDMDGGDEIVYLSKVSDSEVSFQFAQSGIAGSAIADGSSAVYYGEDDYTITFAVVGDTLAIMVGGPDAAQSPMNGTYYRHEEDAAAVDQNTADENADAEGDAEMDGSEDVLDEGAGGSADGGTDEESQDDFIDVTAAQN